MPMTTNYGRAKRAFKSKCTSSTVSAHHVHTSWFLEAAVVLSSLGDSGQRRLLTSTLSLIRLSCFLRGAGRTWVCFATGARALLRCHSAPCRSLPLTSARSFAAEGLPLNKGSGGSPNGSPTLFLISYPLKGRPGVGSKAGRKE